jgi:hypothetical protein
MKKQHIDVCGLLETKLLSSKLCHMYKFRLKHYKLLSNIDVASNAIIIVLWNPNTIHIDLISMSDQGIHVIIHCLIHHFSFAATFVYGFNIITTRRALWDDLRRWSPNSPWLLLGDFNSMLS